MKYSFIISKNSRSLEKQTDNSKMEGEYEVDHFFRGNCKYTANTFFPWNKGMVFSNWASESETQKRGFMYRMAIWQRMTVMFKTEI